MPDDFDIASESKTHTREAFDVVLGIMQRAEDDTSRIAAAKTIVAWAKDAPSGTKTSDLPAFLAGLGKP